MNSTLQKLLKSSVINENALLEYIKSFKMNGVPCVDAEDALCVLEALKLNWNGGVAYELVVRLAVAIFSANHVLWTKRVAVTVNEIFKKLRFHNSFDLRTQASFINFCCQLCEVEELRLEFFDCCSCLPSMLLASDDRVQEAVATMTQVLCSTSLTIEAFVCAGGCVSLTSLLHSSKESVLKKNLQTCHALSREINFCKEMSALGVIPILGLLLHRTGVASVAAGILQNVAREKSSLSVLDSSRIVESVSPLLFTSDPVAQASAVGFLLNLHSGSTESRRALIAALTSSVLQQCFDECVQ